MIVNKEFIYTIKVTVKLDSEDDDFTEKEIEDSFEEFSKNVTHELSCLDMFHVMQGCFSVDDIEVEKIN